MRKAIYSALVVVLLSQFVLVCGQPQSPRALQVIQEQSIFTTYPGLEVHAKEFCGAYLLQNNVRLIELTYPKFIEKVGRANLLNETTRGQEEIQAQGIQVLSWTPANAVRLVSQSGSLYAVIPTTVKMKSRENTWAWELCLIAASNDQGQSWTFVSANCVDVCEMFAQVASEITPFLRKMPQDSVNETRNGPAKLAAEFSPG